MQDTAKAKKGFMGFGGGSDPAPVQPSAPSSDNVLMPSRPSSGGGTGLSLGSLADPNDYIAAHFDKKVNEESARQSLPVDSWRWQKRFFIFSGKDGSRTSALEYPDFPLGDVVCAACFGCKVPNGSSLFAFAHH